jgi:bla regulator protein BlaR1
MLAMSEETRQIDNTELPFMDDPDILGTWESVDFIDEIPDFSPGKQQFRGELYLREMTFSEGGKTHKPFWTWTRGKIIHQGNKTTSDYFTVEMDGTPYLFFEWKSNDYIIRHMRPSYYVLRKREMA